MEPLTFDLNFQIFTHYKSMAAPMVSKVLICYQNIEVNK